MAGKIDEVAMDTGKKVSMAIFLAFKASTYGPFFRHGGIRGFEKLRQGADAETNSLFFVVE